MSGDAELLNFIYQNSQMGVDTIRQLIGVVEDKDLKEHLKTQFQGYEEFHQAAKELLNEHGYDEKGLGIVAKARTYFMINLQTMTDPSASHIASMLITGSSMGIVEAIQKYRQYEDADPKIRDLMDKLRKFEEHNMEKLKDSYENHIQPNYPHLQILRVAASFGCKGIEKRSGTGTKQCRTGF